jgi:hypothetical protein
MFWRNDAALPVCDLQWGLAIRAAAAKLPVSANALRNRAFGGRRSGGGWSRRRSCCSASRPQPFRGRLSPFGRAIWLRGVDPPTRAPSAGRSRPGAATAISRCRPPPPVWGRYYFIPVHSQRSACKRCRTRVHTPCASRENAPAPPAGESLRLFPTGLCRVSAARPGWSQDDVETPGWKTCEDQGAGSQRPPFHPALFT